MNAFPHKVSFNSFSLTHETTLELGTPVGDKFGCIGELDCVLQVAAEWEDGVLVWEVDGIVIEPYGCNGRAVTVTAKSDPVLWPLIARAVKADFNHLDEKLTERAREAA